MINLIFLLSVSLKNPQTDGFIFHKGTCGKLIFAANPNILKSFSQL